MKVQLAAVSLILIGILLAVFFLSAQTQINPASAIFGLNNLADVQIQTPSNLQGLIYNSTTGLWMNQDVASTVSIPNIGAYSFIIQANDPVPGNYSARYPNGTICWTSTNWSEVVNNAASSLTGIGGIITIGSMGAAATSHVDVPSGVFIEGNGQGDGISLTSNATTIYASLAGNYVFDFANSFVSGVSKICIVGQSGISNTMGCHINDGQRIWIHDMVFKNLGYDAVLMNGTTAQQVRVYNNEFNNCSGRAFADTNSGNAYFYDNYVYNCGGVGYPNTTQVLLTGGRNIVQNNHLSGTNKTGIYGIIDGGAYSIIEGNIIDSFQKAAIFCVGHRGTISGNNIQYGYLVTGQGIVLSGAYSTNVEGNNLYNMEGNGIDIQNAGTNNKVSGNTLDTCKRGVQVAASCPSNSISDNMILAAVTANMTIGDTSTIWGSGNSFSGLRCENSFSGANTTATTAVISHGLVTTATNIQVSFSDAAITGFTWSSTGTQVTITPTGTLPASWTCYVYAIYKPY